MPPWEMEHMLAEFFPVLGNMSLWPQGRVPGPSTVCLGWGALLCPLLLAWLTSVLSPQISITPNAG